MSVLEERAVLFRRDTSYLHTRKHNPFSLLPMMHTDVQRSLQLPVPLFPHNTKNGVSAKCFCLWVIEPHLKEDWTMRLLTIVHWSPKIGGASVYLFCPQANCSLSLSFVCVYFPFFFKGFIGVQLLYWSIFPGGGNGNPLQCSHLHNPMDRGAWQFTVRGVTETRTRLSTARTAALQCCVSLCCKTKCTRYMYTHILSFGDPRLCHHGALGTAACAIQ